MATYYWRSAVNNAWTTNNWSTTDGGGLSGTYPQAGDTAIFKASSGQGDCWLGAHVSITKLDMRSDYTGTLRGNTYNFTTTGDMIIAGTQIVVGSGTWTTAGHLNYANVGTFTPGTSTFIMTGTSKILTISAANRYFYNLTINGTVTSVGSILWHNSLTIMANKTLTLGAAAGNYNLGATRISKLYVQNGATIDCGGFGINWYYPGSGGIQNMYTTGRIINGTLQCLYPASSMGTSVWDFGTTYGLEAHMRVYGPATADGLFTFPNKVCKMGGYFQPELRSWYTAGTLSIVPAGNSTDVQFNNWVATYSDTTNTGYIRFDNTGRTGNYWRFNHHVYDWMNTDAGASTMDGCS